MPNAGVKLSETLRVNPYLSQNDERRALLSELRHNQEHLDLARGSPVVERNLVERGDVEIRPQIHSLLEYFELSSNHLLLQGTGRIRVISEEEVSAGPVDIDVKNKTKSKSAELWR